MLDDQGKLNANALFSAGGRILVFSSHINSIGAGQVSNVCKAEHFNNASEEPKMMSPQHDFFTKLGQECVAKCITVDLFFALTAKQQASLSSCNIATMAPVAGISGGDVHLYSAFDVTQHGEKLYF